jgi:glycerol-3-phosphate dehydrogenase
LEDLLLRRARFGMWDPPAAATLLQPCAALVSDELGWNATRRCREEEACALALEGWAPAGIRA